MKYTLTCLILCMMSSLSVLGQEDFNDLRLTLSFARNPDDTTDFVHHRDPSLKYVRYLQSYNWSKRDTIQMPYYFLKLKIYEDDIPISSNYHSSLFDGDYAFGKYINEEKDTVFVCINKDLSIRFRFPKEANEAYPFKNGISKCLNCPWWATHANDSRYGAVARDGTVLFEPTHTAVVVTRNKAAAIDEITGGEDDRIADKQWIKYLIIVKNNTGYQESSYVFYYPRQYDRQILKDCFAFFRDIDNYETNEYDSDDDIYTTLINLLHIDYLAAYNHLIKGANSNDPIIRRCAKKNLSVLRRLFQ